jgi:hypothetical protein
MQILTHQKGELILAEIQADNIIINKVQDALDIMADASYQGARSMIIHEKNFNPEFFNLKSRLAGDILQKFTNYQMKVAIIGDFKKYESKSLQDFIYECNKGKMIFFLPDVESAFTKLT